MKHLMIDLETMGNKSYCALMSIGAVFCDINTGETGAEFSVRVDLQSCLDRGLKVNADTLYWWLEQSEQARKNISEGEKEELSAALHKFTLWVKHNCPENVEIERLYVWGNGSKFDLGILEDAYDVCNMKYPFAFWNERDVRTASGIGPEIKRNLKFEGTAHKEVDDCKHQIKYVSEVAKHYGITFK